MGPAIVPGHDSQHLPPEFGSLHAFRPDSVDSFLPLQQTWTLSMLHSYHISSMHRPSLELQRAFNSRYPCYEGAPIETLLSAPLPMARFIPASFSHKHGPCSRGHPAWPGDSLPSPTTACFRACCMCSLDTMLLGGDNAGDALRSDVGPLRPARVTFYSAHTCAACPVHKLLFKAWPGRSIYCSTGAGVLSQSRVHQES